MYVCAAKVDIGISESHNDDRLLLGSNIISDGTISATIDDDFILAAVCDGVGGLSHGYKAAEITLSFMAFVNRKGVTGATLKNAIEEANRRVRKYQTENDLANGARTTISGVYAENSTFIIFNAGDSRVYRFRHKYVRQLTKDNSYVQDLIDLGEISFDEAKQHPQRNLINKCIGNEETVNPKITQADNEFIQGDIIMLCSDGISDVLSNMEIQEIIYRHKDEKDLSHCCEAIYQKALDNGSMDNLSVLLIRKDGNDNE